MTRGKRKNGEKYTITEKSIDVVKFYQDAKDSSQMT